MYSESDINLLDSPKLVLNLFFKNVTLNIGYGKTYFRNFINENRTNIGELSYGFFLKQVPLDEQMRELGSVLNLKNTISLILL